MDKQTNGITWRAFFLGLVVAALFAGLTVYFCECMSLYATFSQLPVLPYVLLLVMVLLINPLCRLVRFVRAFSTVEIMLVFMMGLVSSGVSTYGFTGHLVPVMTGLFNRSWNTGQTEWNRYAAPFLNDSYFLAADGIQEASAHYARCHEAVREIEVGLNAAAQCVAARKRVQAAEAAAVERELAAARQVEREALSQWTVWQRSRPGLPEDVARAQEVCQAERDEAARQLQEARAALAVLEQEAFAKVDAFRRGLPRGMRAVPGFVKLSGESLGVYLGRFQRLVTGMGVSGDVNALLAQWEAGGGEAPMAPRVEAIRAAFARMVDTTTLDAQIALTGRVESERTALFAEREAALNALYLRQREAPADEARKLQRDIKGTTRAVTRLRRQRDEAARERTDLQAQAEALRAGQRVLEGLTELGEACRGGRVPPDAQRTLEAVRDILPSLDGSLRRYLAGDVPWRQWLGPLSRWGLLLALVYMALMAFNVLIYRQWAHHEKLAFPLAELPLTLAGAGEEEGSIPAVFRNGLFWIGFAISGGVWGYNILAASQVVPELQPMNLENAWSTYIVNTGLDGLLNGKFARSQIAFAMIGLAFLIPAKVSFSLWFFAVLSMIQVLVMVGLGYGQNEASFPTEWYYTLNFRTAEGAGALLVFSSVVLFKCRKYILCALRTRALEELPEEQRREMRLASLCFLSGSLGIVLILWLSMGASLIYTLVVYFVVMVVTIGLMRAVAEGGLFKFQAFASPFHYIRTLFGFDKPWTAAPLFAPLLAFYTVFFLDIKTFMAPSMANSLRIREALGMRRSLFHLAMFFSIVAAAVVSVVGVILIAYAGGADVMDPWFHSQMPQQAFATLAAAVKTPPAAASAETFWLLAGGGGMALLLYLRQTLFWLPHPIGLIMLVSPLMGAYWFSILIGWAVKSLVTKYGNKDTYARVRGLFIGLILGELSMTVVAMVIKVALKTEWAIDMDLN